MVARLSRIFAGSRERNHLKREVMEERNLLLLGGAISWNFPSARGSVNRCHINIRLRWRLYRAETVPSQG